MTRRTEIALWLALLAAFSPVIAEYVRGFAANFSPWSTLLAPVLIVLCAPRLGEARPASPRLGGLLLVSGVLLQLAGLFTATWTVAWIGLPVALTGMALFCGRPPWTVVALGFGGVPVPVTLTGLTTPGAETGLLAAACSVWELGGVALDCVGPVARYGPDHLELQPADAGLPLVAVLALLGWFVAVRRGGTALQALRTAALGAACTAVVQPVAVVVALGLLVVGAPDAARGWLAQGVWCTCAVVGIALSLRAPPQRDAQV